MLRRSRSAFASIGFTALAAVSALTLTACGSGAQGGSGGNGVKVGLITKTDTNPFFVKMKEGAEQAAKDNGVELVSAAGKFDGDNAGQVTAIENMVNSGVKGILITPNDSKAIVPALEKARAKGVLVIALDSPTDPQDATDALFATDNVKAGELIGQYAKAAMAGKEAKIATLDLAPGVAVGVQRHQGFLKGFGVAEGDPSIVCMQDTGGDQAKGQTAMENCLQKSADINVVYTINEPAALGAYTALKAKGLEKKVLVVSVDGGCTGTKAVKEGKIAATSQQYPLQMASQGVKAVADFAKNGKKASGYTDTGVTLVTDAAKTGVDSKDTAYGLEKCWG
ncbi:sugar ABC transporter substrate-binding protein [Streptomyces gardneri]|uniref:Sugar ABC transporter substrate-binding protein n=1 Tax=Streptomyces gardneri TaxID=66892 RepID=A0A4Y3RHI2_9ACTN|nr:sugar ABC transporter substrate-binding protein [Streptomyces gardneri]GEB56177.1 sugar ABC transporter substrate-binding protein [Streptomyces gardneri]GHG98955.1 sugar ABC transporter substrate-binding protein [Streptomyces gardneri]